MRERDAADGVARERLGLGSTDRGRAMAAFRVMINGQNFLVEMDGRVAMYGFFTTRRVEAADPAAAEHAAVQMIRETQRVRDLVCNDPADPPVMDVTSIIELESGEEIESRETGFVWYEEKPIRWWESWRR
jgi:hypothetical protein